MTTFFRTWHTDSRPTPLFPPSLIPPLERARGRFVSFSSLSPFGGSGAYPINDSPQFPPFEGSQRQLNILEERYFHHIPFVIRLSSFVISFSFPSYFPLVPIAYGLLPLLLSFASKPLFWHFLHRCIILLINFLHTLSIPIVQDSYKLPISSL